MFLAGLSLTLSGTHSSTEPHKGLLHLAHQLLPPLTCGTQCPGRVSPLMACGQAVPGSPAPGHCRLHSQLAEFLPVSWNICWITDAGEFHLLSHWKFRGLQSWLWIAPGKNSEYIFASNISVGKDELLHMIWEIVFAKDFVTKLNYFNSKMFYHKKTRIKASFTYTENTIL